MYSRQKSSERQKTCWWWVSNRSRRCAGLSRRGCVGSKQQICANASSPFSRPPSRLSFVSHAQRDILRSEGELDRRHLQQCRLFAFLRVARAVRSYAVTQVPAAAADTYHMVAKSHLRWFTRTRDIFVFRSRGMKHVKYQGNLVEDKFWCAIRV